MFDKNILTEFKFAITAIFPFVRVCQFSDTEGDQFLSLDTIHYSFVDNVKGVTIQINITPPIQCQTFLGTHDN